MIRDLIDDYEKNFINLKNDLINEIEKLEIKNINLSDELKELQKKYDKLYLEFREYKKKYNEDTINQLVKCRLEKIQSNNKYSLEEIKNYVLSKSENVDILNNIQEIVANELEKENSEIYSEMLIRDILNYLYINRKDNILNNILMNSKSFIERSILNYDYTEENAVFAIEILKYYVLGMNKKVAIEWFKRIINSNMLNCLSDKNENIIVDLLYLSLYLDMDDVIFDNVDPIEIIVKARKYDYLWYELYNKFIMKDEKIYNKFAILKLYYNEMYLIDNRVKQVCLSPIMKNIENLISQYESRKTETINEGDKDISLNMEDKNLNNKLEGSVLSELRNIINTQKEIFEKLKSTRVKKFIRQTKNNNERSKFKEILKYSELFKELNKKEINTILVMSVFYNLYNEFNENDIFSKAFNSNSIESEFIRAIAAEIKIVNGIIVKEPLCVFIDKNQGAFQYFDKKVLNKVIDLCNEIFPKVSDGIIVRKKHKNFCSRDMLKLGLISTYLKVKTNDNEVKYILTDTYYCEKCNYKYKTNKSLNKIRNQNNCEVLIREINDTAIIPVNKTKINSNIKSDKNILINNSLKNRRSLGIEEDYNKLIQYYISQNNIGLKEIVNKIILNSEKISALTRTEFITTIICGYICGINKLDLIRAMNIYKLAISCDSIFINRLLNNKDYLEYWNNNFLSLDIDGKIKSTIFNRINNITGFNQVNTTNSRLLSTEFDSKSLNEESQLKKLGYSSTISRSERENILKNKAIPQLGKARVRSHIEWLINMNKNKSTMKNSVIEWSYDLDRLSRM